MPTKVGTPRRGVRFPAKAAFSAIGKYRFGKNRQDPGKSVWLLPEMHSSEMVVVTRRGLQRYQLCRRVWARPAGCRSGRHNSVLRRGSWVTGTISVRRSAVVPQAVSEDRCSAGLVALPRRFGRQRACWVPLWPKGTGLGGHPTVVAFRGSGEIVNNFSFQSHGGCAELD